MAVRSVVPFRSGELRCPECRSPVYGVSLQEGVAWVRCDGKIEEGKRRERCSAHLHIVAARFGVCYVVACNGAEAKEAREAGWDAADLYLRLVGWDTAGRQPQRPSAGGSHVRETAEETAAFGIRVAIATLGPFCGLPSMGSKKRRRRLRPAVVVG